MYTQDRTDTQIATILFKKAYDGRCNQIANYLLIVVVVYLRTIYKHMMALTVEAIEILRMT